MAEPLTWDPELAAMLQRMRDVMRRSKELIAKAAELRQQFDKLKSEIYGPGRG